MATPRLKVIIIVPTYNEKGNIERVIHRLEKEIFGLLEAEYQMMIMVVDDSSPDGTGEIVKDLQAEYVNLLLVTNPVKKGLGFAYTAGMKAALDKYQADIVVEFDADLSHDMKKIPIMLKHLKQGYDMAVGSRYIPGGSIPKNWGWHRKFLSRVGNWTARILITNFNIHDWTGGFRVIKSEVVAKVLPQLTRDEFMGYTFQVGFLFNAVRQGFKIKEVPFHFKDRTLGKSKMPASYIKNTLKYIISVRWQEISQGRVFKFAVVGIIGGAIQLSSLQLLRRWLPFQWATFISIELAILSNFIWSNRWTFGDKKLARGQIPVKFLQFNLTSAGSLLIQQGVAWFGEKFIGLVPLFKLGPVSVDTGLMFAVIGILLGMVWNFTAYSKIIWKTKTAEAYAAGSE